jgi:hypothetical protein
MFRAWLLSFALAFAAHAAAEPLDAKLGEQARVLEQRNEILAQRTKLATAAANDARGYEARSAANATLMRLLEERLATLRAIKRIRLLALRKSR